jgi:hypothetical protein
MTPKHCQSILAIVAMFASITTSFEPAQAFTWDEFWNAVKPGVEKGLIDAAQSAERRAFTDLPEPNVSNNNSEPSQGDDDIDEIPF